MLLKNFDCATEYYDLKSSQIHILKPEPKFFGWFKMLDGYLSALLVENRKLFLLWQKNKLPCDDIRIELYNTENISRRRISVFHSDSQVLEFEYNVEKDLSRISPFEYLDDESFDWGKFLVNIIKNKNRSEIMIDNLS